MNKEEIEKQIEDYIERRFMPSLALCGVLTAFNVTIFGCVKQRESGESRPFLSSLSRLKKG